MKTINHIMEMSSFKRLLPGVKCLLISIMDPSGKSVLSEVTLGVDADFKSIVDRHLTEQIVSSADYLSGLKMNQEMEGHP